jgi:hypothetical protein
MLEVTRIKHHKHPAEDEIDRLIAAFCLPEKRCANPGCVESFSAERIDRRYCSTGCSIAGRLASKREWMRKWRNAA